MIFGLPGDKHEDDPARALKAGHKILDTLHQVMDITWVLMIIIQKRITMPIYGQEALVIWADENRPDCRATDFINRADFHPRAQ